MKKILGLAIILGLLRVSGSSLQAAPFSPTICPTNFTCSISASGTRPLVGEANDGQTVSLVGVVNFDSSSNVSGFANLNANGTVANLDLTGGTCTSGDATTLGTIDLSTPFGQPLVLAFVTYSTGGGTGLLITEKTPTDANTTSVLIGNCIQSPPA